MHSLLKHKDKTFLALGGMDILGLSETWLNRKVPDSLVTVSGYAHFRQDRQSFNPLKGARKENKGGDLILYVRESLAPSVVRSKKIRCENCAS